MDVKLAPFGMYNGESYEEIFVYLEDGSYVSFCDLGARINQWCVPNTNGELENIILGHHNAEEAIRYHTYYGVTVGRVAGRIANGTFDIDGVTYRVPCNNGDHHLHGGNHAFDEVKWDYDVTVEQNQVTIEFRYVDAAGNNGYPGTLWSKVRHTVTSSGVWKVDYEATTDEATLFNPTNHVYFNLNGNNSSPVTNHWLQVPASYYIPVDVDNVPLGTLDKVEGTPFDLRTGAEFGSLLESENHQFALSQGFDHPFVLDNHEAVTTIACPETSRRIVMTTDAPCVVIYTHNYVPEPLTVWNHPVMRYSGVTLETQVAPDAIHHAEWGDIVLRSGKIFASSTTFTLEYK